MLKRYVAALGIAGLVVALTTVASSALAGDKIKICPETGSGDCIWVVETPGSDESSGDSNNGGGDAVCDPDLGCQGSDGCWYKLAEPQPDKSEPVWEGHTDGAIYSKICTGEGNGYNWQFGELFWAPTSPAGPSPGELAARAVGRLSIRGPDIHFSVGKGEGTLLWLWLWTEVTSQTWATEDDPISATASVPGLSVTATAYVEKIVWDMGDGHTVVCTNPGKPYKVSYGAATPPCGYRYEQGGRYPISATTTWVVRLSGAISGEQTVTRESTTCNEPPQPCSVVIRELRTVIE